MTRAVVLLVWLSLVVFPGTPAMTRACDTADRRADLRTRESITIAVTDSGLGGLSVVADTERKLRESGLYVEVELIFYNALFTNEGGYNSLPGREEKVRIFSRALQGLQDHFAPDIILIACNTLSVLYRDTEFAATTATPVVGIVEGGVDLIAKRMLPGDSARTIIFATDTTVTEGMHKAALVELGIPPDHVVMQACPELASYIERGFDSMETEFLIDAYVGDALAEAGDGSGPVYVSFNCTHYGYSLPAWQAAFTARDVAVTEFLNPNTSMIDFLLPASPRDRHDSAAVRVRVVSMVELSADKRESLGRYLHDISPATGAALHGYELRADLFTWRDTVEDAGSRETGDRQGEAR